MPIRMGIVGVGKIALEQHIPSIAANAALELCAVASPNSSVDGVANYSNLAALLAGSERVEAIAICTPPQTRYELAKAALCAGRHVLMEKPPCASLAQLDNLICLARKESVTLYQAWHSQHAAGVEPAAAALARRKIQRIVITWKEDVHRWHPGQAWLWQPGGFGVFDPGMNALSILTKLVSEPIFPRNARLFVPANCGTPIAAELELTTDSGVEISAAFDFRETGPQRWNIDFETDSGRVRLAAGGGRLILGDQPSPADPGALEREYAALYRRFAQLVSQGDSEVDLRPLQLVADIFVIAERISVDAFKEHTRTAGDTSPPARAVDLRGSASRSTGSC